MAPELHSLVFLLGARSQVRRPLLDAWIRDASALLRGTAPPHGRCAPLLCFSQRALCLASSHGRTYAPCARHPNGWNPTPLFPLKSELSWCFVLSCRNSRGCWRCPAHAGAQGRTSVSMAVAATTHPCYPLTARECSPMSSPLHLVSGCSSRLGIVAQRAPPPIYAVPTRCCQTPPLVVVTPRASLVGKEPKLMACMRDTSRPGCSP
jgi:hypothetical protein